MKMQGREERNIIGEYFSSTVCSKEGRWCTLSDPSAIFSRKKNESNSMCFDLPWRIGLAARHIELRLSHNIIGVDERGSFNYVQRGRNQTISIAVLAMFMYSCHLRRHLRRHCLHQFDVNSNQKLKQL